MTTGNRFPVGTRVRTNRRYSDAFPQAKKQVQLPKRGEVKACMGAKIRVLWDGRRNIDTIHFTFLEEDPA